MNPKFWGGVGNGAPISKYDGGHLWEIAPVPILQLLLSSSQCQKTNKQLQNTRNRQWRCEVFASVGSKSQLIEWSAREHWNMTPEAEALSLCVCLISCKLETDRPLNSLSKRTVGLHVYGLSAVLLVPHTTHRICSESHT